MLAPDLAQEFFGDPQVGRNHVLGNPLLDLGVLFSEFDIPLFGWCAEIPNDSFLCGNKCFLDNNPEKAL